ncbi:oxoglutarate iron-dependent oxygenase [Colletotrichum higginsianum]|nr:oxoglutarate iron-dependent oxygenase [Colletotrichum higginsianum]
MVGSASISPSVTSLLLRQQNRRRWKLDSLAHMFARFPRLRELHYEPWREWGWYQRHTDEGYQHLFESIQHSNINLKRLVVFENFNQQYPVTMQQFLDGVEKAGCDRIRNPAPAVGKMIALTSLKLEHLAASFIADASHFFEISPAWEWPNLASLVLTSKLLTPDENSIEIGAMLRAAAAAAMKMPRLETMEIWNGRKGLAALFRYQAFRNIHEAAIVWRGTWKLAMEPSTIQAWEAVMYQYDGWRLDLVQEQLDEAAIKSHGDAVHYLMLSGQVIRPISLWQIQREQEALEGVDTV